MRGVALQMPRLAGSIASHIIASVLLGEVEAGLHAGVPSLAVESRREIRSAPLKTQRASKPAEGAVSVDADEDCLVAAAFFVEDTPFLVSRGRLELATSKALHHVPFRSSFRASSMNR